MLTECADYFILGFMPPLFIAWQQRVFCAGFHAASPMPGDAAIIDTRAYTPLLPVLRMRYG